MTSRVTSEIQFDPPAPEMAEMGAAALRFAVEFIEGRASAPAVDVEDAYELARALRRPPPEHPEQFADLLETIKGAAAKAYDTAGPGYLAYIPGGGMFSAALADFLACVTNRFVNLAAPAPALVQLEQNVIRWLCDVFGFPSAARGVLTSGGSTANFSAVITARNVLGEDFADGTIYASEYVHHSITKSARLAGFPARSLRTVRSGRDLRMDVGHLRELVRSDRANGLRPCLVVGSAGTVNTGAVDPLEDIAAVAREEDLWFHVDGAYGALFFLTDRGKRILAGAPLADSITLDPHKGMFLPYGTGSLLVKDGELLRAAHATEALYLPQSSADEELPDFADYSTELSRDFRGLRVWLPLHLHGISAFRAALDEKLDLARLVYDALSEDDNLDVPWEPGLSIVAFAPRGDDPRAGERLQEEINASKRVFVSSTGIEGRAFVRICVLSHRTHRDRIEEAIDIVKEAAAAVR